jgi:4-amino-4-deoxy-L-arabinose transferase-like glycosyltransferase
VQIISTKNHDSHFKYIKAQQKWEYITKERQWQSALMIFVFALIVRIVVFYDNYELPYQGDALHYIRLGYELSEGNGYTDYKTGKPFAYWPPGWPIIISIIYKIFGQNECFLHIYQTIVSALLCSAIFLLTKKVFNFRIATFAALFSILYAPFLHPQSGFVNLINDPTYHFLLLLGLIFYFFGEKKKYCYFFCGIILGFNALVKPNGLVFPAILIPTLLIKMHFRKPFFINSLLIILGFLIPLFPWTVRNYIVLERLILVSTNSGVNMYVGNATTFSNKLRQGDSYYNMIRAQGDGYEQGQILNRRSIQFLTYNIKNHPKKFLKKLKYHFDPFLSYKINNNGEVKTITKYNWMYVFLVPLIIYGVVSRPMNNFVILSTLFLAINILTALVYQGAVRYRLNVEILLIIIGFMGAEKFACHSSIKFKGLLIWLFLNALIGIFFPTEFPKVLMDIIPGSDPA